MELNNNLNLVFHSNLRVASCLPPLSARDILQIHQENLQPGIPSQSLTWNLKMAPLQKEKTIFQTIMFRFDLLIFQVYNSFKQQPLDFLEPQDGTLE